MTSTVGLLLFALAFPLEIPAQAGGSPSTATADSPVAELSSGRPWIWGAFVNGGTGVSDRSDYQFFWLGVHAGKVLTPPAGPDWLHGQFEYGVEFIPLWQAYTPKFRRVNCTGRDPEGDLICSGAFETGGTYTGLSITPIILRWNVTRYQKWMPWIQGAGGLIWTNHKFPPVGPVPSPGQLGTSVFNFTPQFGVGAHYFVKPKQSLDFSANAVHISNASLGDANPGVNASVQFSVGYSWWK